MWPLIALHSFNFAIINYRWLNSVCINKRILCVYVCVFVV